MKSFEDIIAEVLTQTKGLNNFDVLGLRKMLDVPNIKKGLIREAAAALGCGVSSLSPEDLERFKILATKELFPLDFKVGLNLPKRDRFKEMWKNFLNQLVISPGNKEEPPKES